MDDILDLLDRLIHTGLIALAAVSLIVFGARYPYGQAAAVLIAALLLLVFAIRTALAGEFRLMTTPLDLGMAVAFALVLVQMTVGFPWGWQNAPSVEALLNVAAAMPGALPSVPGTVDYHATRLALVLFLVYAIAFYLTLHSLRNRPLMTRLIGSLIVLVAVVAAYGLFEFLSGNYGVLGWKGTTPNRVRGTLVNPDHFAATLGMVIPLAIGFLLGSTARRRRRHSRWSEEHRAQGTEDSNSQSATCGERSRTIRNPQSVIVSSPHASRLTPHASDELSLFDRKREMRAGEKESRRFLWSLGCVLLIVAVFFTMSRAGIIAVLGGGTFLGGLLWVRESGHRKRLSAFGVCLAALAVIAWIGAEPVLSRFTTFEIDSQARRLVYRATVQMAKDFPMLGVGLGAYERVSSRYAPPEFATQYRLDHAHSEPLQVLAETGIPGALILLLALFMLFKDTLLHRLFGLRFTSNVQRSTFNDGAPQARHDPYNIAIAFGALSAVVTIGLHSFLDFPLRIPANGILLAMILAVGVGAAAIRLTPERAEPLARVRVVPLSRGGKLLGVLGALAVSVFMTWTAVAHLLGIEFMERGLRVMADVGGPEGQADRPWIVETKKNREALGYFNQAVFFDPTSPYAHYHLAHLREQLALRAWNAGLSEEGKLLPDITSRAQAAVGLLDRAIEGYATAIRLSPPYAQSWSELGWSTDLRGIILSLARPGQPMDKDYPRLGLAGLRQAIALDPNNRNRHVTLATFGLGRLDRQVAGLDDPVVQQGLAALQQAVELAPGYLPDALGRVFRYSQSVAVLEKVIPAHAPDTLFAARLLEEQERWQMAKGLYRRAVDLAPDDGKPLYYREYAEALIRHEEFAEARDVLEVVLRFDPQNLDLKIAMAHSLGRLNQPGEAFAILQGVLERVEKVASQAPPVSRPPAPSPSPRGVVWPNREERVFAEIQGRFAATDRAADPLTKALKGLADFHHRQGRYSIAVSLWEKAFSRTPDDAATAFGLAQSYDAIGAWVMSTDYYKKAIELSKGKLEYRLILAERYAENGMNYQAINLWKEILAVRPAMVQIRLNLAQALVRLEQYPDALREYERVLHIDPQNETARVKSVQLRGRTPGK